MVKIHGKYCGPNWTAGKVLAAKNATDKDFQVKPIDDLDAACRIHDKDIRDKGNSFKVDTKLMRKAEKIARSAKYSLKLRAKAQFIADSMSRTRFFRGR